MRKYTYILLFLGVLGFTAVGCAPRYASGRIWETSEVVDLQGAESVSAEILMGAGDLEVDGGADQLLEGEFRYSEKDLLPDISYRVGDNTEGILRVEQDERPGNRFYDSYYNKWVLRLNSDIPLDLSLVLGAGECTLDLEELNLRSFSMKMGAGEATLDLGTAPSQDLNLDIQGGVGQLTVILPPDARIEAHITGGLGEINLSGLMGQNGSYVSEYQGSGPVIRMEIEAGIGELNLLVR
ncbi:MAG: toast rack family protein [Anaerolineales bacterium]